MINLNIKNTSYRQTLKNFAGILNLSFENEILPIPQSLGQGYIKLVELSSRMDAVLFDFSLKEDFILERKKDAPEFYTFICSTISEVKKFSFTIESESFESNEGNGYAMCLTSSLYDVSCFVKGHTCIHGLFVMLPSEWMRKYLKIEEKKEVLDHYLGMKAKGILLKPVGTESRKILHELLESTEPDPSLLFYEVRILKLIEEFFGWLYDTENLARLFLKDISARELERISKVESLLVSNLSQSPPTIKRLAAEAAMSESKLKKIFKAVYNLPPYEYFQKRRMEEVRQMLLSNGCLVKDAGYAAGYSNLSHFTKAFKKQFGQLPSELIDVHRKTDKG